ncbi:glycoside hydrolase family 76 protein [Hypomontagnella submonticulosa]|nr:glycoside hydrolase family 76 protein [Hypomontagnella submonticulosa]
MSILSWWTAWCLLLCSLVSGATPDDLNNTRAAVDALMTLYDPTTGLWYPDDPGGSWWQSGVALWALTEYMIKSGNHTYLPHALNTVQIQKAPLEWWPEGGGDFRADSTDDTGWWALALLSLYELTNEQQYLDIAIEDEAYMFNYWDTRTCGGGLLWSIREMTYHNAISNELYLELTTRLYNLMPDNTTYLNHSLTEWEWFSNSGLINPAGLINDGLTDDSACTNNNQTTWTYNQGVVLGGLVELHSATQDAALLDTARRIADAAVNSAALVQDGVLTEPCASETECEPNGTAFKGIFARELAKLNAVLPDRPYSAFLEANARWAYEHARRDDGSDFYGFRWQGPFDRLTIGSQEAAVQLMVAAFLT